MVVDSQEPQTYLSEPLEAEKSRSIFERHKLLAPGLLVLLCLLHLIANVIYLSRLSSPPSYDCAHHLNISLRTFHAFNAPEGSAFREVLRASPYYPPLTYVTTGLFYSVLGVSRNIALLSLLPWLFILIVATYKCGEILFDKASGLLAATLVSFYPIVFGLTRSYYVDIALLGTCSLAFWFYLRSRGFTILRWSILFGLAAGAAQMIKWTGVFFWLGAVTFHLLYELVEKKNERPDRDLRFINRFSVGYVLTFGVFAQSFDYVIELERRHHFGFSGKLLLSVLLFSIFLLVAFLVSGIRSRLADIWKTVLEGEPRIGRRVLSLCIIAFVSGAIFTPWIACHWNFLIRETSSVVTSAGTVRGLPPVATLKSAVIYLFFLENHQLLLFFFLLFVAMLFVALSKKNKKTIPLLWGLVIGYLALTCVRLKDPRYTMPYLYLVALITADGWRSIERKRARQSLAALAVGFGLFQFLLISFGLGTQATNKNKTTPLGDVTIWKTVGYGASDLLDKEWHVRDVVKFIADERKEVDEKTCVYVLVDHPCVHYEAFNYYANLIHEPICFEYPPKGASGSLDIDATFELCPYLITKNGGDQGPAFSIEGLQAVTNLLHSEKTSSVLGFHTLLSYDLPDGSKLCLWQHRHEEVVARDVSLRFGDMLRMTGYRFGTAPVRKGEKPVFTVCVQALSELSPECHLFIHLYSPSDSFIGSFGGPYPAGLTDTPTDVSFVLDTSTALQTGWGQVAIGVWNTGTGERLTITDDANNLNLGDIVYLDAYTKILEHEKN